MSSNTDLNTSDCDKKNNENLTNISESLKENVRSDENLEVKHVKPEEEILLSKNADKKWVKRSAGHNRLLEYNMKCCLRFSKSAWNSKK